MGLSQDYESSSDEERAVGELPRPIYVRPYEGRPSRVKKPQIVKLPARTPSSKKQSRPLVYERMPDKSEKISRRSFSSFSSNHRQEHLFEYGQAVNGYRFLTTYNDMQLLESRKPPNLPGQEPCYIEKYWSLSDPKLLPTDPGKQINKHNVHAFYQESSRLLKQDMNKIIKKERIRWHPDRMHLPEATHIFQIINDLWESLQKN